MPNYYFDDFSFEEDKLLSKDRRYVQLPPKEMRLLSLLLENAESVVSKDQIIEHVWLGGVASDESITRCVYNLRKLLGNSDIIETMYGKGYRFTAQVQPYDKPMEIQQCTGQNIRLAIFPWFMSDSEFSLALHDHLLDCVYEKINQDNEPYSVLPLVFTRSVENQDDVMQSIVKGGVALYITGTEINYSDRAIIRLELARSNDHSVVNRIAIPLDNDLSSDVQLHANAVMAMLSGEASPSFLARHEHHV